MNLLKRSSLGIAPSHWLILIAWTSNSCSSQRKYVTWHIVQSCRHWWILGWSRGLVSAYQYRTKASWLSKLLLTSWFVKLAAVYKRKRDGWVRSQLFCLYTFTMKYAFPGGILKRLKRDRKRKKRYWEKQGLLHEIEIKLKPILQVITEPSARIRVILMRTTSTANLLAPQEARHRPESEALSVKDYLHILSRKVKYSFCFHDPRCQFRR